MTERAKDIKEEVKKIHNNYVKEMEKNLQELRSKYLAKLKNL
jgi:predicted ATP-grasp superfamily ATP-dependent carboligase